MKLGIYLIILSVFLASFGLSVAADEGYKISVGIPGIPGFTPGARVTGPADYIKGIYNFSLGLAALLALGMIVYGALEYTISAGNTTRQSDAKDRITQAIYGLVLLLGSILILNTINPKIPELQLPTLVPVSVTRQPDAWGAAVQEWNAQVQTMQAAERNLATTQVERDNAQNEFDVVKNKPANDPERLKAELKLAQANVNFKQAELKAKEEDSKGDVKAAELSMKREQCSHIRGKLGTWDQGWTQLLALGNDQPKGLNGDFLTEEGRCENNMYWLAIAHDSKVLNYRRLQTELTTATTKLAEVQSRQATAAPATTTPPAVTPETPFNEPSIPTEPTI